MNATRSSYLLFALFLRAICLIAIPLSASSQEKANEEKEPVSWTEKDTRLANHYIQLLQKEPVYGNVLELLWDLYAKNEQTELLLQYFNEATRNEVDGAKLIYAHLLRKNGQVDEARTHYDSVLDANPDSVPALKALAEIAEQQKRYGKALSLYTRLADHVSANTQEGMTLRMRQAALHRRQDQIPEAVAIWNLLLQSYPGDVALRTEIVSLLLESGETGSAVKVLEQLADSDDPRQKLNALQELTRLYEFISDFENAAESARRGMALLHFKNHQHEELFERLIRTYERFQKLSDLEKELRTAAETANPTEKSLYLLAEFYRLTANSRNEEETLAGLVRILPKDFEYRIRLAEVQMRNDRYEEAAATLDQVLANQDDVPLSLILLRAKIAVTDENPREAEEILNARLEASEHDPELSRKVLEFARAYYLDSLVESLLRKSAFGSMTGSDGESAPIDLARFLKERGRVDQSIETLKEFVASAGEATTEKARRLHQAATAFRELGLEKEALKVIEEAVAMFPRNLDYLTTKTNILIDEKKIDEAVENLEAIWHLQTALSNKSEVDQRIFSLLRGNYSQEEPDPDTSLLQGGAMKSLSEYRKIAAAASRARRTADDSPPEEVKAYFQEIRQTADRTPSLENRYRAAWWAFKLQDNAECYQQLTRAKAEAEKPVIEVEKMLLSLAEQNERPTLMVRHLETLAEIDPENASEYRHRRAEVRFELGFEDEAVRELRELASQPDASLNTLRSLAKVYKLQGSITRQIEVWQKAYRSANVFEKRRVIKQLTSALVESGQPEEALKAQLELMEEETDLVQRRKQLDSQLTLARSHFLLNWLRDRYVEMAQQEPFDRFYPEALARVYQASGNDREAFEAMKKAYYMSGQNESLLEELGELAGRLGDLKSAIYYRRQLIARSEGETTIENWQSLVGMLEKDLRIGEADLLRRRLETKFGQNPEFLGQLAILYRETDRLTSAERVLQKLANLRNWDIHAILELGLLKNELGKEKEALALFEKVIEKTADVQASDYPADLWPIIRVATIADATDRNDDSPLGRIAMTLESYPFLGADLQDEAADWMQKQHAEFQYLPKKKFQVRLRAIEEAAEIHAQQGTVRSWLDSWNLEEPTSHPVAERLWATRYSQNAPSFRNVLDGIRTPSDHTGNLCLALMYLLGGETDPSTISDRLPRARIDSTTYATMAAYLALRNLIDDPLTDTLSLAGMFSELAMTATEGDHVFSELRKAGMLEEAFLVGESLAESTMEENGNFLFSLSQVAGWTGKGRERIYWLDRSIDVLSIHSSGRASSQFLSAMTEKLSLLPSADEKEELIEKLMRRIEGESFSDIASRMEKELLILLAAKQYDEALVRLSEITRRQVELLRPQHSDSDQVRYRQSQSWTLMEQLLSYYAIRFPRAYYSSDSFAEAIGGSPLAPPIHDSVLSQFEYFEMNRQAWLLESLNAPERHRLVQQIYSTLRDPSSPLELGRVLEQRGFHREAIPIYKAEAFRNTQDYAPLRELFDACHEALAPEAGLEMIQRLTNRDVPAPPGLTADYLNEQQARFLFHTRDLERLAQLGQAPIGRSGAPPISSNTHLPFQRALIEAYRFRGNTDALYRLLSHLRSAQDITKNQLLIGARILLENGSIEEAAEWLSEVPLDNTEPRLEDEAITLLLEAGKISGKVDRDQLIEFARHSLDNSSPDLAETIAHRLEDLGHSGDAEGILRLLHRSMRDPGEKTRAAVALLETRLRSGSEWHDLREDLEMSFEGLPDTAAGSEMLLALLRDNASPQLPEALKSLQVTEKKKWLVEILLAFVHGNLEETALAQWKDSLPPSREHLLLALTTLGEDGMAVAANLVADTHLPGDAFFNQDPVRQVMFFAAVGDLVRLHEIHAKLMQEAESDIFHQRGLERYFPTLHQRHRVPSAFHEAGYPELARALFDKYDDAIPTYAWDHQVFLTRYVEFLIEAGAYQKAESVLALCSQKSLRVDLRLFMKLYQDWEKLDEWEERTFPIHLTEGRRNLLKDWRAALAEGREMVEYRPVWQ